MENCQFEFILGETKADAILQADVKFPREKNMQ